MDKDSTALQVDQTAIDRLIAPERVSGPTVVTARTLEGITVYSATGEKAGTLEDVMIDKVSGKIAYAVLAFGGFLGLGERHHPLPWTILQYDSSKGGYVVELDKETVKDAPSFGSSDDVCWEDEGWGRRVHDYYKAKPYWAPL